MGLSAAEAAEKWQRRASQASGDYASGINRVTEAPGAKAARKKDKWRAGLERAAQEGTWEKRVAAVSLDDWKEAAITKGAQRFSGGVQAAQGKMERFLGDFLPAQESVTRRIMEMPDNTPEERMQRALEQMRGTHALKGKFGTR